jgi:hypothetical protein
MILFSEIEHVLFYLQFYIESGLLCFICAETKFLTNNPQITFKEIVFENEIGEGSYGKVFLGKWNDAPVALKFCRNKGDMIDFMKEIHLMMYSNTFHFISFLDDFNCHFYVEILICFFTYIKIDKQRVTSTSKCYSNVWSFVRWSSTCHCHGILCWRYQIKYNLKNSSHIFI